MFTYLMKSLPGRFLLTGSVFMLLGFAFVSVSDLLSRLCFYFSVVLLGYYVAKKVLIDIVRIKKASVDFLMLIAAVGSVLIRYESEGAILLFIFSSAKILETYISSRSTRAISELMTFLPAKAKVILGTGEVVEVPTEVLEVNDKVVVSKGAQIPIDGYIDRPVVINESALTGESLPVEKEEGDEVFAGTLNVGHVFYLRVSKRSHETVFSNIIRLVNDAQSKPSRISRFIEKIESKYVVGILVGVPVFIFTLFYYSGFPIQEAFYRGMVLLTVASPCALIASVTPATLSAISNSARNGVLFKGGAAIEALSTLEVLYSDKTGTLTMGEFRVVDYDANEDVLKEVVYMEQQSSHPIAKAIVSTFHGLDLTSVNTVEPVEEISGLGIKKGKMLIGKPSAFDTYLDTFHYREKLSSLNSTVFVGKDKEIIAYFSLADTIRKESAKAVEALQSEAVTVSLLTGDNETVAEHVARNVGIDYIKKPATLVQCCWLSLQYIQLSSAVAVVFQVRNQIIARSSVIMTAYR